MPWGARPRETFCWQYTNARKMKSSLAMSPGRACAAKVSSNVLEGSLAPVSRWRPPRAARPADPPASRVAPMQTVARVESAAVAVWRPVLAPPRTAARVAQAPRAWMHRATRTSAVPAARPAPPSAMSDESAVAAPAPPSASQGLPAARQAPALHTATPPSAPIRTTAEAAAGAARRRPPMARGGVRTCSAGSPATRASPTATRVTATGVRPHSARSSTVDAAAMSAPRLPLAAAWAVPTASALRAAPRATSSAAVSASAWRTCATAAAATEPVRPPPPMPPSPA